VWTQLSIPRISLFDTALINEILDSFKNKEQFAISMADDKEQQKAVQKKFMQLQVLEQQIKQVQEQVRQIDSQLMELIGTEQSLEELSKINNKPEIMVPVSGGIFVKAKLEDTSQVLVNVGASTAVPKSIAETKKLVHQQVEELEKLKEKIVEQLGAMITVAKKMQTELKQMVGE